MNKIVLSKIRDLNISAASGLVKRGHFFYVAADDENSLHIYSLQDSLFHKKHLLFSGNLPEEPKLRKKLKPDLEALCILPKSPLHPEALLALPSGSKPNRFLGSYIEFKNEKLATPQPVDFSLIYSELLKKFTELNIEGVVIQGPYLKLFQRGNGVKAQNAIIDLDVEAVRNSFLYNKPIEFEAIRKIKTYDLGKIGNTVLGFTDACALHEDKIFFLSVAENSASTYLDGEFQGAMLGCLTQQGEVLYQKKLTCLHKPEGLWIEEVLNELNIYIVTDADDRDQAASLYHGLLPQGSA